MAKATIQSRSRRLKEMVSLLLSGKPMGDVVAYLSDKYGVSKVAIYKQFAQIRSELKEILDNNYAPEMKKHLDLYEELYEAARKIRNRRLEMLIMDFKEKLLGFHKEAFDIQINNKTESVIEKEITYNVSKLTKAQLQTFKKLSKKAGVDTEKFYKGKSF